MIETVAGFIFGLFVGFIGCVIWAATAPDEFK